MRVPRFICADSSSSRSDLDSEQSQGFAPVLSSVSEHGANSITAELQYTISGAELHHLRNVLRLGVNDQIEVIDLSKSSRFLCKITKLTDLAATALVEHQLASPSGPSITLLFGISKPTVCDFVVEKCTELGVARLILFHAVRSQGQFSPLGVIEKKLIRYRRIATAAAKQSGAVSCPEVKLAPSLNVALAELHQDAAQTDLRLALIPPDNSEIFPLVSELLGDPRGVVVSEQPQLEPRSKTADTYLIVGPEGGLAPEERSVAFDYDYRATSLGPRTLRAETAVVVACAFAGMLQR